MEEEYISIREFASRAGVTPQAVYKRVRNQVDNLDNQVDNQVVNLENQVDNQLSTCVKKVDGKIYIKTGVLSAFGVMVDNQVDNLDNQVDNQLSTKKDELTTSLQDSISILKAQLEEKDKQIALLMERLAESDRQNAGLLNRLGDALDLTRNGQVLIGMEKKPGFFRRLFKWKEK
jgi:predicted RNase H-like nuclease (RuvC/YqgF family)